MSDEVVDVQARQDIAVQASELVTIKEGIKSIRDVLNNILTAIIVAMAGAAGAAFWNVVFHQSGR